MRRRQIIHHGTAKARGCPHARLGNFGKLFPELPGLAVTEAEAAALGGPGSVMHDQANQGPDSDNIPAGYTFFAQFIDHDMTLDTATELHGEALKNIQIEHLPNLRTPSLDLDCVYGFGPEASPYSYDQEVPGKLLIGSEDNDEDVPRNSQGRALIGDPRNDENIFVSQLQLLFLKFHNKVYDSLVASMPAEKRFERAQIIVRFHYQYLVVHDFLRRVCDPETFNYAMDELSDGRYPKSYKPDANGQLPMPVEFSVAAYRFGHSMVRSRYAVNGNFPDVELFDEEFGTLGFSSVPPELIVDWQFLFEMDDSVPSLKSKRIDHLLADELIRLPDPVVGNAAALDRSLAFRNLLRGNVLSLPSGQKVADALKKLGYNTDPHLDLKFDEIDGWDRIDPAVRGKLENETPLFFYILRESGVRDKDALGPVGSAILLEVFLGVLTYCKTSFLNFSHWQPDENIATDGPEEFELADLIYYVES